MRFNRFCINTRRTTQRNVLGRDNSSVCLFHTKPKHRTNYLRLIFVKVRQWIDCTLRQPYWRSFNKRFSSFIEFVTNMANVLLFILFLRDLQSSNTAIIDLPVFIPCLNYRAMLINIFYVQNKPSLTAATYDDKFLHISFQLAKIQAYSVGRNTCISLSHVTSI